MRRTPPPGAEPGPGETLDQLIGDWWVFQLKGGHRFSTDDLMTAWRASIARPDAVRYLDMGCGIGSVGLYTLGMLGGEATQLTGIEAQEISLGLVRRSVARNGLGHRVSIHQGDLRDPGVLPADASFELITGSPPYQPLGKGVVSPHPQRAACRVELRGSCIDYAAAARRWLAPGGRFVFCMIAADPRVMQGVEAAGLVVLEWFDIVFRRGNAPLIAVLTCARREDVPADTVTDRGEIVIRDADGRMSEAYAALRGSFGFAIER